MKIIPLIRIPGSEAWEGAYELSRHLESAFPSVDASDLAYALSCNPSESFPLHYLKHVTELNLHQRGENEGDSWIWSLALDDGRRFVLEGWCDYTGWDCQSDLTIAEASS